MGINSEMIAPLAKHMKTATFTNWTKEKFIGYWDGRPKEFAPGQSMIMPDYLAHHFAKHLTNRELLRTNSNGSLIYKDGDKMTSPKHLNAENKEDRKNVPILFQKLFDKAYSPDDVELMGEEKDDVDTLIASANKNKEKQEEQNQQVPSDSDEFGDKPQG